MRSSGEPVEVHTEFKSCEVSTAAFERGYGTPEEIMVIRSPPLNHRASKELLVESPFQNGARVLNQVKQHL
jgi:hypothetical protein